MLRGRPQQADCGLTLAPSPVLKLCGRARKEVVVRGGVLAQDVGLEKTVLVISTILASLRVDEVEASEAGKLARNFDRHPRQFVGYCLSEATFFLVGSRSEMKVTGSSV